MKSKNFRVNEEKWEQFKEMCKGKDSNASKALRHFIDKAVEYNSLDYEFNQTSIYNFIKGE